MEWELRKQKLKEAYVRYKPKYDKWNVYHPELLRSVPKRDDQSKEDNEEKPSGGGQG